MLDRVTDWLASERAAAILGYVVGAVIGAQAAEGMSLSGWIWSGIAVLCVVQLRLFGMGAPTSDDAATEEA